jgi:hypothetical protein
MNPKRIGGIVLVLAGIGVAYTGYQMSQSLGNQLSETFNGSPTDSVMLRYVGGAVLAAIGGFFAK